MNRALASLALALAACSAPICAGCGGDTDAPTRFRATVISSVATVPGCDALVRSEFTVDDGAISAGGPRVGSCVGEDPMVCTNPAGGGSDVVETRSIVFSSDGLIADIDFHTDSATPSNRCTATAVFSIAPLW